MPTATIVNAWSDAVNAYLAVQVAEAGGSVEYIGFLPLVTLAGMSASEKKVALTAAAKAVRDAQQGTAAKASLGITGTVAI